MQDRIVGPLTMVQFIYAIVGCGFAYTVYSTLPKPLNVIVASPIALFTFALAFVKVNERPFATFFLSVAQFMLAPKQRIWHHEDIDNFKVVIYKNPDDQKNKYQAKQISKDQMEQLAKRLDQS